MTVDQRTLDQIALSWDEYRLACERLDREPNEVELGMFGALWSEHCGYKNSKPLLRLFPTTGARMLTKAGEENAGAIDIGDDMCVVMKIESHNHPSAIEPYQGAATGVGGIVRDIFAMGAYPIAILDSLRFGPLDDPQNRYLFEGVVAGIGGYGNCLGIPTVGGEVSFEESYAGNPLVNAMCVGLVRDRTKLRARRRRARATPCSSSAPTPAAMASTARPSPRALTPMSASKRCARRAGRQPVPGEAADGGLLRARLRSTATGSSGCRTSAPPGSPAPSSNAPRKQAPASSSTWRRCRAAKPA